MAITTCSNGSNREATNYSAVPERSPEMVQARLARRPARAEAPPREVEDDGTGEMTDATFDERMRAKVGTPGMHSGPHVHSVNRIRMRPGDCFISPKPMYQGLAVPYIWMAYLRSHRLFIGMYLISKFNFMSDTWERDSIV